MWESRKRRFFVNFEGSKMKLVQFFNNFAREDDGVTAIEYGLIAALIAIVIIGAVTVVGTELCGTFDNIAGALQGLGVGVGAGSCG
jgi:pilus assembly protein Flp/PilA